MLNTHARTHLQFNGHSQNGDAPKPSRYKHILVPTGLTTSDRAALQLGLEMASTHRAKLSFLYVLPNVEYETSMHWLDAIDRLHQSIGRQSPTPAQAGRTEALKIGRRQLLAFVERELPGISDRGIAFAAECRTGDVTNEIARFANGVDLVIMASPPLRWWSSLVPSRAQRVLQRTKKEVILLRPRAKYVAKTQAAIA